MQATPSHKNTRLKDSAFFGTFCGKKTIKTTTKKTTTALAGLAAIAALTILAGCASSTRPGAVGITRQQLLLVPASTVEKLASDNYAQETDKAKKKGKLITSGPDYNRLLKISQDLRKQAAVFRDDTARWNWQVILVDDPTINASCAPGGKITFYTGIINKLKLTDDEIAAVMGHEIAHALREHGRERLSQAMASNVALQAFAASGHAGAGGVAAASAANKYLFELPNSRENETEADKIGLELAARAGYNPNAAVTLWRKMSEASKDAPPEFLSTHPSNETRINQISALIPAVMPLYAASEKPQATDTIKTDTINKEAIRKQATDKKNVKKPANRKSAPASL